MKVEIDIPVPEVITDPFREADFDTQALELEGSEGTVHVFLDDLGYLLAQGGGRWSLDEAEQEALAFLGCVYEARRRIGMN